MKKKYYRNNKPGFILINTLIFLSIITLLTMTAAEISLSQLNIAKFATDENDSFHTAQSTLNIAYQTIAKNQCFLPLNSIKQIDQLWWNSTLLCHKKNAQYYIELLPFTDPCTRINEHRRWGVNYYRITARGESSDQLIATVLQATYAMPSKEQPICHSKKIQLLQLGRQSWREIDG